MKSKYARAALALWLAFAGLWLGASLAADRPQYAGRGLVEVLEELRQRGLNVIYSTAVVDGDIRVTVEPEANDARGILDEILPPLGLAAQDAPGGSVLIVAGASATGTLSGRAISSTLRQPVVGAVVRIDAVTRETTTRPDGSFELDAIPSGRHSVRFSATGFNERVVDAVVVRPNATAQLSVVLQALATFQEKIIVTPGRRALVQDEQVAARSVGSEDALLAPAIGGDVSRIVELLPGVAAPDNSASLHVRGCVARDVSMVLDGLELYSPFHLPGLQSPFSFIDTKIVETIDLLGGGFTADLGDRHGGFVELSTGLPLEPYRGRIEIGTLNSRFALGVPVKAGSLLVSARAWYPEALRDTMELGETGLDPRFADTYVKYAAPVSPTTVLSAHALFARDRLEFDEPNGAETVDSHSESAYLWFRALRAWGAAGMSETIVSGGTLSRTRNGVSEPEDQPVIVRDERDLDFFGLRQDVSWSVSGSQLWKGGFEIRPMRADYRYASGPADAPTTFEPDVSGMSVAVYGAYRAGLSERFATELGLRWDRQTYTDDNQLSPRLNGVWRIGSRSELRFGVGRFFQSQRIYEMQIEDGLTDFLPAELSRQIELTVEHRFTDALRGRVNLYDRELSNLHPRTENLFNPLELYPETEVDRVVVAPTNARLRGIEFLLGNEGDGPLHWWLSYTWASAEDEIDGTWVPRSWDQPHAGRALVAYLWDNGWYGSLSGTVHTGWPTTPVTATTEDQPDGSVIVVPVVGSRNSLRFPTYARLDLKTGRTFTVGRGRMRVNLEIVNVTSRKNACCVDEFFFQPNPDGTVAVDAELGYWLGFTPSLSVLWEF